MTATREQIPISLVSHFDFCPRRAWLEAAGETADSAQMTVGNLDHKRVDDPGTSRPGELRAVDIFSDALGITGRLDALLMRDDGTCTIREYKATPIRRSATVTEPMRTQLALQEACVTEMGNEVTGTEIYFTSHNRVVAVELDDADRTRACHLVDATRSCVTAMDAPEPLEDDPRCTRCSHAGVCLPDERKLSSSARRIVVADPDTQVVHLTTPGSRARSYAGQMIVEKSGETLAKVPLDTIQGLEVHGNIDLTGGLIRELLWRAVPIVWCTGSGRMVGWARSTWGPNGLARVGQHIASAEGRLALAREFISAKIANQGTQIRRSGAPSSLVEQLRKLQHKAQQADRWQDALGIEGEAAALYFANWPLLIKERIRPLWEWHGRSGRPATDPINAMLNYCYAILTSEAVKALTACGLDPHAGFLHSSSRNKPALALDLIEEFRAPIADSVVQTVINNGEIQPKQFSDVLGTWRMDDNARKSLITAFERRMTTEFTHPIFGYSVTWRRALEVQARQVLGYIDRTQDTYRGIRLR